MSWGGRGSAMNFVAKQSTGTNLPSQMGFILKEKSTGTEEAH